MKAMIFAAGLGTRLRPLTDHTPKALIPLAGRPMLERVIERMVRAGVTDLTINVHHHAQQIVDWLASHRETWPNLAIHVSDERALLLDTGGGLLHARTYLEGDEPILVHNADILTDLDLGALYRHHLQSGALATLLVAHRQTSRYLLMDRDLRLCGWINKATGEVRPAGLAYHPLEPAPADDFASTSCRPTLTEWAFGGVHVISPTLLQQMDEGGWTGAFSIIPFYLSICREACIKGYPAPEGTSWFDIGKPTTLRQAEEWLAAH